MSMDKDDLTALLVDAPAEEVDQIHRLLHEWSVGPDSSFPVQLSLLTKAQWRIAANLPRLMNDARKLIELHLAEYRRQTAALIGNLSAVGEEQTGELNNIFKAHTEALNHASGSFRSQLKEIGAAAMDIRRHLDDGVSAHHRVKNDLKAASEKFQKTCAELDNRISGLQIRRDWLALFGLIAIGIVIGFGVGVVIAFKYR